MANNFNKIQQEGIALLDALEQKVRSFDEELKKVNKSVNTFFKGGNAGEMIDDISRLQKEVKSLEATIKKQAKTESDANKEATKQIQRRIDFQNAMRKQREQSEKENFNQLRKSAKALQELEKIRAREAASLKKQEGLYNKVNRGLRAARLEYRDLALRKKLDGKLNNDQLIQLGRLEAKIKKYDAALKNVDSSMGNNQRRVGNYKGAFDSLGFSVAQITRESPAFLNSMQTGFMAISNNIPILVDEINKLNIANVELAKKGKPTINVLKQLGAAVFSWQSLISLGIVALTALGPKLIKWATDTGKVSKEVEKLNEEQSELNSIIDSFLTLQGARERVSLNVIRAIKEETLALDTRLKQIKDTTLSEELRLKAAEELLGIYPDLLKNITARNLLDGKGIKRAEEISRTLSERTEKEEALSELAKVSTRLEEIRLSKIEKLDQAQQNLIKTEAQIETPAPSPDAVSRLIDYIDLSLKRKNAQKEVNGEDKQTKDITRELNKLQKEENELQEQYEKIALKVFDIKKKTNDEDKERINPSSLAAIENQISTTKEELKLLEFGSAEYSAKEVVLGLLESVYNALTKTQKKNTKQTKEERQAIEGTIAWYEKKIKANQDLIKWGRDGIALTTEQIDVLKKENDEYSNQIDNLETLRLKNLEVVSVLEESGTQKNKNIALDVLWANTIKAEIAEIEDLLKVIPKTTVEYGKLEKQLDSLKSALNGIDVSEAIAESKVYLDRLLSPPKKGDKDDEWRDYFNGIVPLLENSLTIISQARDRAFEAQLSRLEKEKDIAIQFAGESADAKLAIEEQYERKRAAIQRRQAEAEKQQAIFSIIINTAQAVVSLLDKPPLAIAAGVIGAAQLALVAATPIPEFYKGTMNAPEGLALVDERRPEIHTDKKGNIKSFGESKANYRYLSKGDKIYKSREEYFNKELASMLSENDITSYSQMFDVGTPTVNVSSGLKKHDFVREIRGLRSDIMSKESSVINIDKNGFHTSVSKGGVKRNKQNNILRLKKGIV